MTIATEPLFAAEELTLTDRILAVVPDVSRSQVAEPRELVAAEADRIARSPRSQLDRRWRR